MNGATTVFITDADNREVLEYDGASGQVLRWYAYGLGPNDVLNQMNVAASTRATFVPDIQGSLIATLDSNSAGPSKRSYLPYGGSVGVTGTFGYTGQRIDPETNGLYYYRARMYAPMWGRFMQPDPVGYAGGSNLYAYVDNDPLNSVDPTGLAADTPQGVGDKPVQMAQAGMALCAAGPVGCAAGAGITAAQILGGAAIVGGAIILNSDTASKPPAGSRPIDQTPWSGDHQEIKEGIGAGPRDNVRISPTGDVWGQNPDGTWTNHGPASSYTGSGKPSGQRGIDRE